MKLYVAALTVSIFLLCSCNDEEQDGNNGLSNAQIGSVAQSITSLTEAAVQNEVAKEGESAPTVIARVGSMPYAGLGLMGNYGSGQVAPRSFVFSGTNIDFTLASSFSTSVDLNSAAYPNATGTLNIDATVTGLSGSTASGSVTFNPITVTTADNVSITDPNSGATASWPNGTTFNYTVTISWTHSDSDNWSYTTTTTSVANNRIVTVTGKGGTFSGDVDHNFTWVRTVSRAGGGAVNVSLDSFSGTRDVVWADGSGNIHTVNWVINSISDISVTVDGFTFNFNSLLALVALLHANLNHDG